MAEQRVANILLLDSSNIRNIHLEKAIKAPAAMKKRPYHGKSNMMPEVVYRPAKSESDQPLLSFQTSFQKEKQIKDHNGFRTTKTVYAKVNGGGEEKRRGDDAVALETIAKKHNQDSRLHFITNPAKPNSSKKNVFHRYDGRYGRERQQTDWKEGEAHWVRSEDRVQKRGKANSS